jgi:pSer/pThr/pTyr-binding forkhead associated (FHA) protein
MIPPDATGLYSASTLGSADVAHSAPRLVVERAPGHDAGMIYDLDGEIVLGRGDRAEIRLEDPFASARHALIYEQGNSIVIEDLGSTNGTYLNEELLQTARPLHPGDRVRIGDSEFAFEVG